jgi:hypothetical protein
MENWIEIISFTLPQDAYLIKGRLESEGIDIILKDELTTQVYNFYSNAIGGVKLLVKEYDFEKAHAILVESKYIKIEELKPNKFLTDFDSFSSQLLMDKTNLQCPFCKSENVTIKKQAGYVVMFSFLLLGLPIPIFKKRYHCFDCDKDWKSMNK